MDNTFTRFETHPAGGLQPSADTPQEAFSTGDQTELDFPYFADDNGVSAGVWECAPSRMVFDQYPVHEMMTILSGSVTLTSLDDDRIETFIAGDTFFVAKGTRFVWEITETLRKYYFISA
ncbi:MAG: cupin domain-containing protein [Acidimicrobiales bacterium]